MGCFRDDSYRDLPEEAPLGKGDLRSCSVACDGFSYFALQDKGRRCFCGNAFATGPSYVQLDDSACYDCGDSTPVLDDGPRLCGSANVNAVYARLSEPALEPYQPGLKWQAFKAAVPISDGEFVVDSGVRLSGSATLGPSDVLLVLNLLGESSPRGTVASYGFLLAIAIWVLLAVIALCAFAAARFDRLGGRLAAVATTRNAVASAAVAVALSVSTNLGLSIATASVLFVVVVAVVVLGLRMNEMPRNNLKHCMQIDYDACLN